MCVIGSKVVASRFGGRFFLATSPSNGDPREYPELACVGSGVGTVVDKSVVTLRYTKRKKLEYVQYLVRCKEGTGWIADNELFHLNFVCSS
jgi:hypothetical protein